MHEVRSKELHISLYQTQEAYSSAIMYRKSSSKLGFSFTRAIQNAAPAFTVAPPPGGADADLTAKQKDDLVRFQLSLPDPRLLVEESFYIVHVTGAQAPSFGGRPRLTQDSRIRRPIALRPQETPSNVYPIFPPCGPYSLHLAHHEGLPQSAGADPRATAAPTCGHAILLGGRASKAICA